MASTTTTTTTTSTSATTPGTSSTTQLTPRRQASTSAEILDDNIIQPLTPPQSEAAASPLVTPPRTPRRIKIPILNISGAAKASPSSPKTTTTTTTTTNHNSTSVCESVISTDEIRQRIEAKDDNIIGSAKAKSRGFFNRSNSGFFSGSEAVTNNNDLVNNDNDSDDSSPEGQRKSAKRPPSMRLQALLTPRRRSIKLDKLGRNRVNSDIIQSPSSEQQSPIPDEISLDLETVTSVDFMEDTSTRIEKIKKKRLSIINLTALVSPRQKSRTSPSSSSPPSSHQSDATSAEEAANMQNGLSRKSSFLNKIKGSLTPRRQSSTDPTDTATEQQQQQLQKSMTPRGSRSRISSSKHQSPATHQQQLSPLFKRKSRSFLMSGKETRKQETTSSIIEGEWFKKRSSPPAALSSSTSAFALSGSPVAVSAAAAAATAGADEETSRKKAAEAEAAAAAAASIHVNSIPSEVPKHNTRYRANSDPGNSPARPRKRSTVPTKLPNVEEMLKKTWDLGDTDMMKIQPGLGGEDAYYHHHHHQGSPTPSYSSSSSPQTPLADSLHNDASSTSSVNTAERVRRRRSFDRKERERRMSVERKRRSIEFMQKELPADVLSAELIAEMASKLEALENSLNSGSAGKERKSTESKSGSRSRSNSFKKTIERDLQQQLQKELKGERIGPESPLWLLVEPRERRTPVKSPITSPLSTPQLSPRSPPQNYADSNNNNNTTIGIDTPAPHQPRSRRSSLNLHPKSEGVPVTPRREEPTSTTLRQTKTKISASPIGTPVEDSLLLTPRTPRTPPLHATTTTTTTAIATTTTTTTTASTSATPTENNSIPATSIVIPRLSLPLADPSATSKPRETSSTVPKSPSLLLQPSTSSIIPKSPSATTMPTSSILATSASAQPIATTPNSPPPIILATTTGGSSQSTKVAFSSLKVDIGSGTEDPDASVRYESALSENEPSPAHYNRTLLLLQSSPNYSRQHMMNMWSADAGIDDSQPTLSNSFEALTQITQKLRIDDAANDSVLFSSSYSPAASPSSASMTLSQFQRAQSMKKAAEANERVRSHHAQLPSFEDFRFSMSSSASSYENNNPLNRISDFSPNQGSPITTTRILATTASVLSSSSSLSSSYELLQTQTEAGDARVTTKTK